MAGLTNAELISEMEVLTELSGTDIDTSFVRYLNIAGRELWAARAWKGREKEVVLTTVAPYTTGTVTVTLDSTTVTGSGTTFTSAMVGRKFALSAGGPIYRIYAYVSATEITLARAYREATASGSSYTIYQDEYNVGSDVKVVRDVNLIYNTDRGHMTGTTEADMDARSYLTRSITTPRMWAPCVNTTEGNYRIRVYPIPDIVYGMRVLYQKAWTELFLDTGRHDLGEDCDRLLLLAAMLLAQRIPGAKQQTSEPEVAALTEKIWREQQVQTPMVGEKSAFDDGAQFVTTSEVDLSSL